MTIYVKTCLLGDGAVGKTSLVYRYLGRPFSHEYIPTLGTDFVTKTTEIKKNSENTEIRYHIWDLAGQPSFDQIRPMYYRGAIAGILIFDLSRPKTLYSLDKWLEEFSKYSGSEKLIISVVGNKSDLRRSSKSLASATKVREYIDTKLMKDILPEDYHINYIKSSAKTGKNVDEIFHQLGTNILEYYNF